MPELKSKSSPRKSQKSATTTRHRAEKVETAYSFAEREEIFRRFQIQRREPKSELEYSNPFTVVVAVMLSAQATDIGVNKATHTLFKLADTPQKIIELGEDGVRAHLHTVNLYPTKARNLIALSHMIMDRFNGQIPRSQEELIMLPGVGRKTANVVRSIVYGDITLAVDTHIFRVANRILLAPGKTPDTVEDHLLAVVPQDYLYYAHHWILLHGRYVCKARRPECERCIIADLCKYPDKTNDVAAPLIELPVDVGTSGA